MLHERATGPESTKVRERAISDSDVDFLVKLAQRKAEQFRRLKKALKANDEAKALDVAREMCGLKGKKQNPVNARNASI